MPRRIINALYTIAYKLAQSLKRFPESLALITITALLFIDENHNRVISNLLKEDFMKLPMVLLMGFVLFLCFRVLNESDFLKNRILKISAWIFSAGFSVLYYFFLLPELLTVHVVRYIAIVFAMVMAFLFIPYLKRKVGFEMYIIKLIIGLLITYLYAGVLCLGLIAIVFTVDQLFTLHINGRIYLDLWIVAAMVFAPAYFLGDIPKQNTELDEDNYSKILKILFLYIIMPILSIYTAILYVYFAKVLITQTWPQGMVSNLVLWYSFITAAIIFLIKPLWNKNLWAYKFCKAMPIAIIPLIFMCFWAMGIRINSYGITESRYYVLVGALWVLFTMCYWIIRKSHNNIILPISLAIIALITVTGPQSATSVSYNSQSNRLTGYLEKNNMLKDGKLVKAGSDISKADISEISSIIRYIDRAHGLKKLAYMPSDFSMFNAADTLGFEIDYSNYGGGRKYYNYMMTSAKPIDISGYRYYSDIRTYDIKGNIVGSGSTDYKIEYNVQSGIVTINKQDKKVYEKKIADFAANLPRDEGKGMEMNMDELTFTDKQGDIEVKYIFRAMGIEADSYGNYTLSHADFSIFIK